ncbi:MAG TPA: hypothetical protein VEY67_06190 [Candidatus Dormibacteraeota bacterium]|nr:hypothetical protein [Candidatus Dormibacteraeota bacterium]
MDDSRWVPGMPVLERQALPAAAPAAPPRSIPETAPTPLQKHYINLSAVALVAGAVAITALETGSTLASPLVKLCILVGSPILIVTTADASLRIWRSAWAWMPVNRNRGLFRFAWLVAAALGIVVFAGAAILVLLS